MLLRNKPNIDTEEFLSRLRAEISGASSAPPPAAAPEFPNSPAPPTPSAPLAPPAPPAPPLRRLFQMLSGVPGVERLGRWGWSLLRARETRLTAHKALVAAHALHGEAADLAMAVRGLAERQGELARRTDDASNAVRGLTERQDELARRTDDVSNTVRVLAERQGELARRTDDASSAVHELTAEVARLRMEILFQQRRLTSALEARAATSPPPDLTPNPTPGPGTLDAFYLQFEDVFRGDREDIKRRVAVHAERFAIAGAGEPGHPIVDLGCGRGEWLEALRERGLAAYGVDTNALAVEGCRARGLDAHHADAVAHLRSLSDAALSGVSAFHLVEHLPLDALVALLDEALRVLRPGGILLLETPNPENLLVGARNFWFDLTHRHPIPPPVLEFLVRQRGFVEAEIVRLHPYPWEFRLPSETELGRRLDDLLHGPQDYAVVARKP